MARSILWVNLIPDISKEALYCQISVSHVNDPSIQHMDRIELYINTGQSNILLHMQYYMTILGSVSQSPSTAFPILQSRLFSLLLYIVLRIQEWCSS